MNYLKKNILYTLAYYSALKFPLTTFEVQQQLVCRNNRNQKSSLREIRNELNKLLNNQKIINRKSFWALKGEEFLIEKRLISEKRAINKIRQAYRWSEWAKRIPYLRGFFLMGTLAMKNVEQESDWDVLVVLRKNRIWLGRLLVSGFFHLARKRRHHKKTKDRFCFNHFLTEEGLIFQERSRFSANEINFAIPLVGANVFKKMTQLNRDWIKQVKPNWAEKYLTGGLINQEVKERSNGQKILERALGIKQIDKYLDRWVKKVMINKIVNNPKTYYKNADIRYGDLALVFLPIPKRNQLEKIAKQKMKQRIGKT